MYQIEAPPGSPSWFGSPCSFVAPTLLSRNVPLVPESCAASTKSSFAGGNLNHVNVYGPPSCIASEASRSA